MKQTWWKNAPSSACRAKARSFSACPSHLRPSAFGSCIDRDPCPLHALDERMALRLQPLVLLRRVDQQVDPQAHAEQGQMSESALEDGTRGGLDEDHVHIAHHVRIAAGEGAEHDGAGDAGSGRVLSDPSPDLLWRHRRRPFDDFDLVHASLGPESILKAIPPSTGRGSSGP